MVAVFDWCGSACIVACCVQGGSQYVNGGCKWWHCVRRSGACHPAAWDSVFVTLSLALYHMYYIMLLCSCIIPVYIYRYTCVCYVNAPPECITTV